MSAKEVAQRYGVCEASGRNYIRRIPGHMENPLRVTETLLKTWEAGRAVWQREPQEKPGKKKAPRRKQSRTHEAWIPGVSKIPMRES